MNDQELALEARLNFVKTNLPDTLNHPAVLNILLLSIAEDLNSNADYMEILSNPASGDVTSQAIISLNSKLEGKIFSKADGIVAGLPIAEAVCTIVDPNLKFHHYKSEGERVRHSDLLAMVTGPGQALLAAERPMLNFLGRLSGIATMTNQYINMIAGTKVRILDTRKTAPGLRYLDKYAVRIGGGTNHRTGLFDMVLIKDNHIDAAGSIQSAVEKIRTRYGKQFKIEVEVKNLAEFDQAFALKVDRIMLDNMSPTDMREAVIRSNRTVQLEASGNVTAETLKEIADTGVDFISSGALTHSAPVLDISMRLRYY